MNFFKKPKFFLIVSMIVFGTIGLFVKYIPLSSGEIALYRAILAIVLLGIFLLITKQKIDIKTIKKDLLLLLISGMAMGINWILLFEAYNYTSVSVATLSYYFAPVLVMVVSPILFKEKLSILQIICFVGSTIGLVLLTGISDLNGNSSNLKGIIFGILAAIFYATVIIFNKFIKGVSGVNRTFLQFVSSIIVLLPYVLLTSGINVLKLEGVSFIYLLIIGIMHTGICYCMYFSSVKELRGQEVAIFSYIDPLVAVIVSLIFLKETMGVFQIIGGILILGFSVLNEIRFNKK
jgi:drug/metabolite transporter (DMT)-like permease